VEAGVAHAEAPDNLDSVGGGKLLVQGDVGHKRVANVLAGNGQGAETLSMVPRKFIERRSCGRPIPHGVMNTPCKTGMQKRVRGPRPRENPSRLALVQRASQSYEAFVTASERTPETV
jgi:hypothetical protein